MNNTGIYIEDSFEINDRYSSYNETFGFSLNVGERDDAQRYYRRKTVLREGNSKVLVISGSDYDSLKNAMSEDRFLMNEVKDSLLFKVKQYASKLSAYGCDVNKCSIWLSHI